MKGRFVPVKLSELIVSIQHYNPFQRVIDENRVQLIIDGLLKEKEILKVPSVIQTGAIQIAKITDKHYIIDGQHRFMAYKELNQPEDIYIQLWEYNDLEDALKKFKEINSNTPIEEHVLKSTSIEDPIKKKYDILIKYVESTYKHCIRTTNAPQWPNINNQHFRKLIPYIPEFNDSDSDNIIVKFEEFNMRCKRELERGKTADKQYVNNLEYSTLAKLYINRYMGKLWREKAGELN